MKENLLARTSELFFSRPLLWLPVLAADLLGFGVQRGQVAILNVILTRSTQYHSALGGTVSRGPITQSAIDQVNAASMPIALVAYFLRIVLYVIALAVTAHLVRKGFSRLRSSPQRLQASTVLLVALRVLIVFVVCLVLWIWLLGWLGAHGHTAIAQSPFFIVLGTLLVVVLLAFGVTPSALRMIAGGNVSTEQMLAGRTMALAMALLFVALQFFVSLSERQLLAATPTRQVLLKALASLLTAVPYILMFIGFALIAAEEPAAPLED